MNMKPLGMLIVLYAIVVLASYGSLDSIGEQPIHQDLKSVRACDLGKTVQLIGRLGRPMTEVIEIEGHWEDRGLTKSSRYQFVVTAVANQSLNPPVKFDQHVVTIDGEALEDSDVAVGETCVCTAIELGRFRNIMEQNWKLFYDAPVQAQWWGEGPFTSEIILCKRTLVRKAKSN